MTCLPVIMRCQRPVSAPGTRLEVVEDAALPVTANAATIAAVQIVRPNIATTLRPCDPAAITRNEIVSRPTQSLGWQIRGTSSPGRAQRKPAAGGALNIDLIASTPATSAVMAMFLLASSATKSVTSLPSPDWMAAAI
jgi:hypothetical protein